MLNEAPTSLVRIHTPLVMIFPTVIDPKPFKLKGKVTQGDPVYSASFVLDPTSEIVASVKAAIVAVCKEKWPGRNIAEGVKSGEIMLPITPGNTMISQRQANLTAQGKDYKGDSDFMKDQLVLKTGTKKFPPQLGYWDTATRKWIDLDENTKHANASRFYFGAEALLEVNLSAYDRVNATARDGVKAYLQKVYVTGKGKRLSGGQLGSETFKGYAGSVSDQNPTEGMNDEIPF
jgi:Protein of unknown function (DUF2815)